MKIFLLVYFCLKLEHDAICIESRLSFMTVLQKYKILGIMSHIKVIPAQCLQTYDHMKALNVS